MIAIRWSCLLTLLLVPACSPKSKTSETNQPPIEVSLLAPPPQDITYYKDIQPLLERKCVSCHQTGGIAPFALTDPTTVVSMQRTLVAATESKSMPPWLADDRCNTYQYDRSMSDDEIQLLNQWSSTGAKLGSPNQYEEPEITDPGLSRVDREIIPAEAYKPKDQDNDYRCFVIDWPETTTQYITGFGVQPGHPDLVHHVIAYKVPANQVATVKALDDAEEGPGYTCFGGPIGAGASLPQIAQWAPGSLGRDLPAKTGLKIEPGSKIVMQVHYNTEHGNVVPDQSKLLLKLDRSVEKEAYVIPFTNVDWVRNHTMLIPAGQNDVVHKFQAPFTYYASAASGGLLSSSATLDIYSSALHMHLLGQETSLNLAKKDGSTSCLLDIPSWDFHWQGSYVLKDTVTVSPGDQMKLECHFNNGTPKDVNWGEGTDDEMCIGFVYVTAH